MERSWTSVTAPVAVIEVNGIARLAWFASGGVQWLTRTIGRWAGTQGHVVVSSRSIDCEHGGEIAAAGVPLPSPSRKPPAAIEGLETIRGGAAVNNDGVVPSGKSANRIGLEGGVAGDERELLVAVPSTSDRQLRGDVVQVARIRGDVHGGHRARGGKSLPYRTGVVELTRMGAFEPERKARAVAAKDTERTCKAPR